MRLCTTLAMLYVHSYEVREQRDGMWGIADENGTWNGMIRKVMDNVSVWKI